MTRDYRRGSPPPRPRPREPKPCFFWFVLGGLLGAFAVGVAWTTQPQGPVEAPSAPAASKGSSGPSFQFYDILPEMEVAVPEDERIGPAAQPPRPSAESAPHRTPTITETPMQPPDGPSTGTAAPADAYLVQVASFRRPSEARRLQAKLAGLGIQAQIQTVTIDNKDTYHRVRTGALAGREQADHVRSLLQRHGLEGMTIKVK